MITRSVSEARRQLSQLIDLTRQGEDVVIIKDSRPVAALRRIDDSDLELAAHITAGQFQRLVEWDRQQPHKAFSSPGAALKYLKTASRKKR